MEPSIGAVNCPVQYFYPIGAIIFSYDSPLLPTSFICFEDLKDWIEQVLQI